MKSTAIQFGILAIVSALVGATTFASGRIMANHWSEILPNEKLPWTTVFASHYGYLIGVCCCAAAMIGVVLALKENEPRNSLAGFFVTVACTELIAMAFIGFAYAQPSLNIMYRLGG